MSSISVRLKANFSDLALSSSSWTMLTSTLMMEIELIAREDFIAFIRHERFKSFM
jgi:hypothetical protein